MAQKSLQLYKIQLSSNDVYVDTIKPSKKKTKNWFSRLIYRLMQVKALQNAPREHSAILLTFIKLPLSLRPLFWSGNLRHYLDSQLFIPPDKYSLF